MRGGSNNADLGCVLEVSLILLPVKLIKPPPQIKPILGREMSKMPHAQNIKTFHIIEITA